MATRFGNEFLSRLKPLEIAFGGTVGLLALTLFVSFLDVRTGIRAASEVDEAQGTLARLDDLSVGVERVVAIARVFLLTGTEDFLRPLGDVQREVTDDLAELRQTFSGDADRSAIFAELARSIDRRVALTRDYIALRRTNDLVRTVSEIPAGGERLADQIRVRIQHLKEAERGRLEQARTLAAASHASMRKSIAAAAAVSLLLLLLALEMVRRQAGGRVALEREIFAASEHECSRVGNDLHDGLGQELTLISFGLGTLARTLENEDSAHARTVRELRTLAQRSIVGASRVARSLALAAWREQGVRQALMILARDVNEHSGVSCTACCAPDDDTDEPAVASQLLRIAQEAVTNALKHGKPRTIELHYRRDGTEACLTVLDDGIGIPPQAHAEGLGLRSMKYRAEALNGTLDVRRRPEGGTEVRCSFKLPGRPAASLRSGPPRARPKRATLSRPWRR